MADVWSWRLALGSWTSVFLLLPVLALLAWSVITFVLGARADGPASPTLARQLLALRVLGLALGAVVLGQVEWQRIGQGGDADRVVILIDESASMGLADRGGGHELAPRIERARAVLSRSGATLTAWRDAGIDIELRAIGSESRPISLGDAEALEAHAPATRLVEAFGELASRPSTRAPSAVVLLTDGVLPFDPAAAGHEQAAREAAVTTALSLGAPVTTINAGAPEIRDVAVASLGIGDFAFSENVTEFRALLFMEGVEDQDVIVSLYEDGQVIGKQLVRAGPSGSQQWVTFEHAPAGIGVRLYEIEVTPLPGEATSENNRRGAVVKVLRDKVRVLHVAGRPDWDVRALRTLLRRDPNVELLSYYILRDGADGERDAGAPLSLIAFPVDELFDEQLGSFDLVIFHNYDAATHGRYLERVASYVQEGGALVVIGGDLGVADGDYAPLSPLLPVDTSNAAGWTIESFRPQLSQAGRLHPVTAWLASAQGGGWSQLAGLEDFNPTPAARGASERQAQVLLAHPTAKDPRGQAIPILSVSEPGKGRVMVLSTGSSWRLGFAPEVELIDGARPYDRLWLSALRWLLRDDADDRLSVELDRSTLGVGDRLRAQVRTRTPTYAPEPAVNVEWSVRRLTAATDPTPPLIREGSLVTDAKGRSSIEISELEPGAYEIVARRRAAADPKLGEEAESGPEEASGGAGNEVSHVRRLFQVEGATRELATVSAREGEPFLRRLADETGGLYVPTSGQAVLPREIPRRAPGTAGAESAAPDPSRSARVRSRVALWSHPLVLLLLLATMMTEWWLRRSRGLR